MYIKGEDMNSLESIEIYAKENYIPIARKQTINYMVNLFKTNNYQSFLEIGTAIGYTSTIIALIDSSIKISTIELDEKRAKLAIENFNDFKVNKQIEMIIGDATTYNFESLYDVIFIDASKKRNQFYLEKLSKNLNTGGTIIIDNMNLDDFWINANAKKKQKFDQIMLEFKKYLLSLTEYEVNIYNDIGDGIAVLKKK